MKRTAILVACCTTVLAGALAGALAARSTKSAPDSTAPAVGADDVAAEAGRRDADIAFFERRVGEDPASAADRARLAALYLRRARETGGFTDVERAADQAKRSLALRDNRNEGTYVTLTSALLAQHDFAGALDAARALVAASPEVSSHLALLGEVLLEVGRYDEAARAFALVERDTATLSTAPRLTRWYELTGHLDRARTMARYAVRLTSGRDDMSAEQRAWFLLRAGELEAKAGASATADSLFDAGLAIFPDDYRLLAAKARLAAGRSDWKGSIELAERAITVQLEPGTLGLIRDAWAALGDTAQASSYARAMTASALAQPGAIHRAWGLHLVDRGERVPEVLRRVRLELETRRDVYGYDLEAWALHALGRNAEAWTSMEKALAQGTEDAQLSYHAGAIASALGRTATAREHLARALALNPSYQHAADVRARLAALSDAAY